MWYLEITHKAILQWEFQVESEKIISTTESILNVLLMHLDEEHCQHSIRDIVGEIKTMRVDDNEWGDV